MSLENCNSVEFSQSTYKRQLLHKTRGMKQNGAGWKAGSESKEPTAIAGANDMLDEVTGSLSSPSLTSEISGMNLLRSRHFLRFKSSFFFLEIVGRARYKRLAPCTCPTSVNPRAVKKKIKAVNPTIFKRKGYFKS